VYVGVCGREFGVNHDDLDFTSGHDFTYIFGDGANVFDAPDNDPRSTLPLNTNAAAKFPRYIRQESPDSWDLEEVTITLNPVQPSQIVLNALAGPNQHPVLGGTTGKFCTYSSRGPSNCRRLNSFAAVIAALFRKLRELRHVPYKGSRSRSCVISGSLRLTS
jgi:hypothetical protein